jgi:hypothetical protein
MISKTRKNVTRGWKLAKPSVHQRTIMLKKCGHKCFLGPHKSFPICRKGTCKIDSRGVYSAYIRSKQFKKHNISKKAKHILIQMGLK